MCDSMISCECGGEMTDEYRERCNLCMEVMCGFCKERDGLCVTCSFDNICRDFANCLPEHLGLEMHEECDNSCTHKYEMSSAIEDIEKMYRESVDKVKKLYIGGPYG